MIAKIMIKIFPAILALLIMLPLGFALGIAPAIEEFNFEPGINRTFQVKIYGENEPFEVKLSISGELRDFIKLEQEVLAVPDEGNVFAYEVNLPSELKPGRHKASIVIEQQPKASKTGAGKSTFGAMPAVGHVIAVNVPYEGKYAEAKISVPDVKVGEIIDFAVIVTNYGGEDISNAKGVIKIYDSEENEITSIETENKGIKKGESTELYAHWTPNVKAGIYKAKALVDYDHKKTEAETSFSIGDLLIEIIDLSPKELELGKISKIELEVESMWNSEIKNVYAFIDIKNGKSKEETITTSPVVLKPWQKEKLFAYWDTTNYEAGEYSAEVILNYEDKIAKKKFKLTVNSPGEAKEPSKTFSPLTIALIIGIIILIIVTLVLLFKKMRKEEETI